jgi:hypothetical protein
MYYEGPAVMISTAQISMADVGRADRFDCSVCYLPKTVLTSTFLDWNLYLIRSRGYRGTPNGDGVARENFIFYRLWCYDML